MSSWLPPEEDPRPGSDPVGEKATYIEYLNYHRQTLRLKCEGLTPEQLAFDALRAQIARADAWLDTLDEADLGRELRGPHGRAVPVRDVLVHMIEEYARHNGHADLLRECIDGRTGE